MKSDHDRMMNMFKEHAEIAKRFGEMHPAEYKRYCRQYLIDSGSHGRDGGLTVNYGGGAPPAEPTPHVVSIRLKSFEDAFRLGQRFDSQRSKVEGDRLLITCDSLSSAIWQAFCEGGDVIGYDPDQ